MDLILSRSEDLDNDQHQNGHRTKYTKYTTKKILSSGNDYLNNYLNFAFPVKLFTMVVFIVMLEINS